MFKDKSNLVLEKILEKIELPDRAYELAEKRYVDIGNWFHRPESTCVNFDPHVFSQGSLRLGTANRPENEEEFDLDMGCNLRQLLKKDLITQEQLKALVGKELKLYKDARNIKEDLAEKKRCWRLEYRDELSFHMDIVPCIPESGTGKIELKTRMIASTKLNEELASNVSELAVSITDNTDPQYKILTHLWRISNPEGYAKWFESRMKTAEGFFQLREKTINASIATLPYYRWKTPLQSTIQLLKRHRDTMFKGDEESKPISVIITTLAARAYNGENDLVSALSNVLSTMDQYIQNQIPFVANPVNPVEDFADKWYSKDNEHLNLKENFYKWLFQARADFQALCSKENSSNIAAAAEHGLSINLDKKYIERALGLSATIVSTTTQIKTTDPQPWLML